jgi:hypothetical protein
MNSWLAHRVGDVGDQWTQAPTAQETKQGYKKTDAMSLQLKTSGLEAQLADLSVQTAGLSPEVETLHGQVLALLPKLNALVTQGKGDYWSLLSSYNAYEAQYVDILSRAEPADADAPPPPPKVVPKPGGGVETYAQPPPKVTVAPKSTWGWWVAGGLALVGAVLLGKGIVRL